VAVRVYAPFENGAGFRVTRSLHLPSVPRIRGTPSLENALPQLAIDARPGWPANFVIASSLRVDVDVADADHQSLVSELGKRFVALVRLLTRQWWVGRGASDSVAPLQNAFVIDHIGMPRDGKLNLTYHLLPWLNSERLLDERIFGRVCHHLMNDAEVPSHMLMLLDSVFAMLHGEKEQALLIAAIAVEGLFTTEAYLMLSLGLATKSHVKNAANEKSLSKRLDSGAKSVFGSSFAADFPKEFSDLESLWVARHLAAHGRPEALRKHPTMRDNERFGDAMEAVFKFYAWVAAIRKRETFDLMNEFLIPLIDRNRPPMTVNITTH
jgi:hypothetical protein